MPHFVKTWVFLYLLLMLYQHEITKTDHYTWELRSHSRYSHSLYLFDPHSLYLFAPHSIFCFYIFSLLALYFLILSPIDFFFSPHFPVTRTQHTCTRVRIGNFCGWWCKQKLKKLIKKRLPRFHFGTRFWIKVQVYP